MNHNKLIKVFVKAYKYGLIYDEDSRPECKYATGYISTWSYSEGVGIYYSGANGRTTTDAGQLVCELLTSAGVKYEWDGNGGSTIKVSYD